MILLLTVLSVFMTGVIWVIQLLVYPNFERYSETDFSLVMNHHAQNISFIVMVPMVLELGISIWWVINDISLMSFLNGVIVALIWISTFFIQVPAHNKLRNVKDNAAIQFLVQWNWLRTIGWTIKSVLLIIYVYDA